MTMRKVITTIDELLWKAILRNYLVNENDRLTYLLRQIFNLIHVRLLIFTLIKSHLEREEREYHWICSQCSLLTAMSKFFWNSLINISRYQIFVNLYYRNSIRKVQLYLTKTLLQVRLACVSDQNRLLF